MSTNPNPMAELLNNISRELRLGGDTTSDTTIRQNIIREFIYRGAAILTDARILAPEVPYSQLDVHVDFPSDTTVDYPVAEGAEGQEGDVTWTPFNFSLKKAEGHFKITDEAVIRGYANLQYQTGVKRLAEAFAKKKNINIIQTVFDGAGQTHATGGAWDGSAPKIVEDINKAISMLLESDTARLTLKDIGNTVIALPLKAYNKGKELTVISNIKMSYFDYVLAQWPGLQIVPFKEMSLSTGIGGGNDLLAVVAKTDTARHGVLSGGKTPLVEEKRVGSAMKHTVRQWFGTKVVPDSESVTTSSRIVTITGILGTP